MGEAPSGATAITSNRQAGQRISTTPVRIAVLEGAFPAVIGRGPCGFKASA
jgi:hypothetical protein